LQHPETRSHARSPNCFIGEVGRSHGVIGAENREPLACK
jgi:hypothetical protein